MYWGPEGEAGGTGRPIGRPWDLASSRQGVWVLCHFGGDAEESLLGGLFFWLGVTLDPFLVPELDSAIRFRAKEGPREEQMSL